MPERGPKTLYRIVTALLLPFLTCGVQWYLWEYITPYVWFLFFPTVFFSSRIGGKRAGIVSTAISAALVIYVFIPPQLSLTAKNHDNLLTVAVFLFMGVMFSYTHDRLEKATLGALEAREAARVANEQLQAAMIERLEMERQRVESDLVRSEERFRSMFVGFRDALMTMTPPEWRYSSANPAALDMFGAREEAEFSSHTPWSISPDYQPDGRLSVEKGREMVEVALRDGYNLFSWRHKRLDGSEFPAEIFLSRIELQGDVMLQASVRDVSGQKQAETEREATLELLGICNSADRLPDLMPGVMDFFLRISGCEAVGLRLREGDDFPYYDTRGLPEEFVSAEKDLCARDHGGDPAARPKPECICGSVLCGDCTSFASASTSNGSFWSNSTTELLDTAGAEQRSSLRNRCNSEGYESVALLPLRYHTGIFGLFQFVDRRKGRFTAEQIQLLENLVNHFAIALSKLKSDELLRESERFNLQIISNAEEGVIVTGTDLRYQVWNPYMERLTGLPARDVLGRHVLEVFPFLKENGGIERMERVAGDQTVSSDEFPFHSPYNGATGWVCDSVSPLKNTRGDVIGIISVVRDITSQKLVEEALRRKNMDMEQFTYATSHDLRTPLVTMKTFLGFLENDMAAGNWERFHQDLQFVKLASDKMHLLLDNLQDLSRLDQADTRPVRFSLMEVVADSLDALGDEIRGGEIDIRLPDRDLVLLGDRQRLCQVWQNLVENAIRFRSERRVPRIELGVRSSEGAEVFFVKDNGIGIDPEYATRIFRIFEKLDSKSPGAGIGLHMIQRAVEKYDGTVWVESEGPDTGACFCFTIPRALVHDP